MVPVAVRQRVNSLCLRGLVMYKGFRLNYLRSVQYPTHSNAFCFPITEGTLPDASVCTDVNALNEILQSRGTNIADGKPTTLIQIPQTGVWIRLRVYWTYITNFWNVTFCFSFTGGLKLSTLCKTLLKMNIWSVSNVYWTVHHCNSWRMKDQLDVTCYFISLIICSTCFGH